MSAREYVRAEVERSPSGVNINTLAENWLSTVPAAEMPAVVHEMAVTFTRQQLTDRAGGIHFSDPAHPRPVEPLARPGRSWRERLSSAREMLNRTQSLDGCVWRLGVLSAEQLRRVAKVRRDQAATLNENGEQLEKLAAVVEEHGVAKADDLPDAVLDALIQAATA